LCVTAKKIFIHFKYIYTYFTHDALQIHIVMCQRECATKK
jgi:hypothetical protein